MQDSKCICKIIDLYKDMIMAAGYRSVHDFHMAEDIFQITMFKLLNTERNMGELHSTKTRNFIYAVARNTAIDMYRKESKRSEFLAPDGDICKMRKLSEEVWAFSDGVDKYCMKYGFSEKLSAILEELSETDREMIILKYFYRFTNKELSKMYSIEPAAADKKIRKILSRIEILYI